MGFRPHVWQLARRLGITGWVLNDGEGVLVEAFAPSRRIDEFCAALQSDYPPLARVSAIERQPVQHESVPESFSIVASAATAAQTGLPADAATCEACLADVSDPGNRRHGYAFTNCTHCGPRLSIVEGIPYDRANTTMRSFELCPACAAEYADPADRRFHAQPNACPDCGPQLWLEADGEVLARAEAALDEVASRLRAGQVVAIKGIGGIHLAVDASNAEAVARLRQRKRRPHKPLALMARDVAQIRRWCEVSADDEAALRSPQAPVVLLPRLELDEAESCQLAPRQTRLGFMLPYSPLHHLLMARLDAPLVLTSGNLSSEPQCIDNDDAVRRLAGLADALLLHDRDIANRIDDSVARRMGGKMRVLRRARGYAPQPLAMPAGFPESLDLLAMGAELKNTFCLMQGGKAVLSQHMGDLENHVTYEDYERNLELYAQLFQHRPSAIVVDRHPEYLSSKLGRRWAQQRDIPLLEVQHHHAHMAACMAENGVAMETEPVLGIVLDGLGFGDDGELWGGEFLLADYRQSQRLGGLRPVALPGAAQAMRAPWRNLWAHLHAAGVDQSLWPPALEGKPVDTLAMMLARGVNSPLASSCGRLFDAVAAAVGVCAEEISYEGQAAMELEALCGRERADGGYGFAWGDEDGLLRLDPAPMWRGLVNDLAAGETAAVVARRFHDGLAHTIVELALCFAREHGVGKVVLSGGVFQNHCLFEAVSSRLGTELEVLTQQSVPMNDGGLALGQAAIAAARLVAANE